MCAHHHRERKVEEKVQDCGDEIRDSVHISSYFSLFHIPPTFSTPIFILDLVHNNNNAKWDVSENPKEKSEKKFSTLFQRTGTKLGALLR
jgi:hypothetical protein